MDGVKSKNEIWFFQQIRKAEDIISKVLEKSNEFGLWDKKNLEQAIIHAGIIDVELVQLMNEKYDEFSET